VYFFGEAYDNPDSPPGYSAAALVRAGFDSLYDYRLYNGVKGIFAAGKWCNDLDGLLPDPAWRAICCATPRTTTNAAQRRRSKAETPATQASDPKTRDLR
jgi:hypothetical protein